MRRLAAAGAIALLVAACGGGGTSASAALVRDAPKKTTDAGTSRWEVVIERPSDQAGMVKEAGEADYRSHSGHMLIDLSQFGLPGPPLDAYFDNAVVYEKFPQIPGALPPGKSWVKVDLADRGAPGLGQTQVADPSQPLDYLRGASDHITRVGTEDVRGTQTTHYKTVVDLKKAAALSPNARKGIEAGVKLTGSATQPVDVWLDAQGRVRRMKYTVDLSQSKTATTTPTQGGSATYTLELFDFGVPVQTQVPPADQVVDINELTAAGGK